MPNKLLHDSFSSPHRTTIELPLALYISIYIYTERDSFSLCIYRETDSFSLDIYKETDSSSLYIYRETDSFSLYKYRETDSFSLYIYRETDRGGRENPMVVRCGPLFGTWPYSGHTPWQTIF